MSDMKVVKRKGGSLRHVPEDHVVRVTSTFRDAERARISRGGSVKVKPFCVKLVP